MTISDTKKNEPIYTVYPRIKFVRSILILQLNGLSVFGFYFSNDFRINKRKECPKTFEQSSDIRSAIDACIPMEKPI